MSSSDHCGIGTVKTFLDDMLNHTGCVRRVGAGLQNDCVSGSRASIRGSMLNKKG